MNYGKRAILLGLAWGIVAALSNAQNRSSLHLIEEIDWFSFRCLSISTTAMITMILRMLPLVFFQVLFSAFLYERFCSVGIYYFSRCQNRQRWFLKECGKLFGYVVLFLFFVVLSSSIVASGMTKLALNWSECVFAVYYILLYACFLYIFTLIMNLIAIHKGSELAFVVSFGGELFFISSILWWNELLPLYSDTISEEILLRNRCLVQWNLFSHLILCWHSSENAAINQFINQLQVSFPLSRSLMLFLILCILVTWIGMRQVKDCDIMPYEESKY